MAKVIKAGWARIGEPTNPVVSHAPVVEELHEEEDGILDFPGEPDFIFDAAPPLPEDADAGDIPPERDAGAYQAAYDELVQAAQDEVAAMLEDARKEALTIIRESEAHANAVREQAWEEGYSQAFDQAKRECDDMLGKARREIDEALAKLPAEREQMLDELESQMLDVSLDVAEKILHIELDRDDGAYLSMLRGAMARIPAEEQVTIRMNTAEFERFFNCREIKIKNGKGGVNARLIADPSLNRYDAVVESPGGVVDAGAGAQIRQMRKNMGKDN